MDQYEKLEKIGEGTYGKVRRGARRSQLAPCDRIPLAPLLAPAPACTSVTRCTSTARRRAAMRRRGSGCLQTHAGVQGQGHQERRAGGAEEDAPGREACTGAGLTACRGFESAAHDTLMLGSRWPMTTMPLSQMEEEGVPSTTLREVSLLLMLSESNHIVK
jgi:hypothetical protein